MKCLGLILYTLLVLSASTIAQTDEKTPNPQTTQTSSRNDKRNIIQLTPVGYISLPKDYWAYMQKDYMDAWIVAIESLDGKFKITLTDGIIRRIYNEEVKNSKWLKELKTENYLINYALAEKEKSKLILAKINSANFSAVIKDDSDIDKFLEIISQYRSGRCERCFSSNTKGLKKYFEKLNKQ